MSQTLRTVDQVPHPSATVALYLRISRDPDANLIGIERHETVGRTYIADRWPDAHVQVYADDDLTAADPNVTRPSWLRMLDDIRTGDVTHLVATEQSRLTRQPSEWEQLCLLLTKAGIDHVHTLDKGVISVAPEQRLLGRVLAAVDAEEVERIKARTRRAHAHLAADGRPSGGSSFGYRLVRDESGRPNLEVDVDQAAVIRRMATMALAGHGLRAIAEALNDDRVPTARGGKLWRQNSVRSILTAPTTAGLRARHGEIVGPGRWEPILDRATWDRLRSLLTVDGVVVGLDGRRHQVARGRQTHRRRLLTGGLSVCGLCGRPLESGLQQSRSGVRRPAYRCVGDRRTGSCGRISAVAELVDELVLRRVSRKLAGMDLADLVSDGSAERRALAREVGDAESRMAEAAALYGAGEISRTEWDQIRTAAQQRADQARLRLDEHAALLDLPTGDAVAGRWDAMTLAQRRQLVQLVVDAVTIGPGRGRGRAFDLDRVSIDWRA